MSEQNINKEKSVDETLQNAEASADEVKAKQTETKKTEADVESEDNKKIASETSEPSDAEKLAKAEKKVSELKDRLLRQMAEFDNYRKRTIKEKSELILSGGQRVLESLLPVLDDLERAQANMEKATDVETLRQGVELIIDKLTKTLSTHGLKKMDTTGVPFDTDFHEAVAITPAQDEKQKNHVIDTIQPGYTLGEKVIRHAKVVVGQ